MSIEPNVILSAADVAEAKFPVDADYENGPMDVEHLVASHDPEPGISFHVQMQGHTKTAMDDLIVEAAAQLIVGRHREKDLSKRIEERCIALVTKQADAALEQVTAEIIDQPLTPSFGEKQPVTMRQFIGLTGREYLTERVDRDGKPSTGGWSGSQTTNRIELLVSQFMQRTFKQEIEKATNEVILEIQKSIRSQHADFLAAEKARLRDALAKAST